MIRHITFSVLVMTQLALATTYYVDPAGSNENDTIAMIEDWRRQVGLI